MADRHCVAARPRVNARNLSDPRIWLVSLHVLPGVGVVPGHAERVLVLIHKRLYGGLVQRRDGSVLVQPVVKVIQSEEQGVYGLLSLNVPGRFRTLVLSAQASEMSLDAAPLVGPSWRLTVADGDSPGRGCHRDKGGLTGYLSTAPESAALRAGIIKRDVVKILHAVGTEHGHTDKYSTATTRSGGRSLMHRPTADHPDQADLASATVDQPSAPPVPTRRGPGIASGRLVS